MFSLFEVNGWRRDIERKVRQVGVIGTIRHVTRKVSRELKSLFNPPRQEGDPFDAKYGTETTRIVSVGALDIPDSQLEHSNRYEAVDPQAFYRVLDQVPVTFEEFVFIDIGSGKGRALLLASKFAFREIIGVEHSAALTEIARKNIQLFKDESQACHKITAICHDATTYGLPDASGVMYLHNPFDRDLMVPMVASVEASLRASPRSFYVVYHKPLHRDVWDQSPLFVPVTSTPLFVIYRNR